MARERTVDNTPAMLVREIETQKSESARLEATGKLVKDVTENRFNALVMIEALAGAFNWTRGNKQLRQAGRQFIEGVCEYLESNSGGFKLLFPYKDGRDDLLVRGFHAFNTLTERFLPAINAYHQESGKQPPRCINIFAGSFTSGLKAIREGRAELPIIQLTYDIPQFYYKPESYARTMTNIASLLMDSSAGRIKDIPKIPEQVIFSLANLSQNADIRYPLVDLYKTKRGNTSLEDIFSGAADYDSLEGIKKMTDLLENLPKGDYLWWLIASHVFFNFSQNISAIAGTEVKANEYFEEPDTYFRILAFQTVLSTSLLRGATGEEFKNPQVTNPLDRMVKSLHPTLMHSMLSCVFLNAIDRFNDFRLYGGKNRYPPVTREALLNDVFLTRGVLDTFSAEEVTGRFIYERRNQILKDLEGRFGGSANFRELRSQLEKKFKVTDLTIHFGEVILKFFEERGAGRLHREIEKLNRRINLAVERILESEIAPLENRSLLEQNRINFFRFLGFDKARIEAVEGVDGKRRYYFQANGEEMRILHILFDEQLNTLEVSPRSIKERYPAFINLFRLYTASFLGRRGSRLAAELEMVLGDEYPQYPQLFPEKLKQALDKNLEVGSQKLNTRETDRRHKRKTQTEIANEEMEALLKLIKEGLN